MDESLGDLLLILVFSCAYCAATTYFFFLVWFRFSEFQARLIQRNEAHIKSKWSLAYRANVWIRHWSYKWLARFNTLFLLLLGWAAVLVTLYELWQELKV